MELSWRQASIAVLATALAWSSAGCGDDDEPAPPQGAEAAQETAQPEDAGSESRREHLDGGASARPRSGSPTAADAQRGSPPDGPPAAIQGLLSSEELSADLRRWRELRAQLDDESSGNDERAQAELEEVEERLREALAEARQAQGPSSEDLPDYRFGEGPGADPD